MLGPFDGRPDVPIYPEQVLQFGYPETLLFRNLFVACGHNKSLMWKGLQLGYDPIHGLSLPEQYRGLVNILKRESRAPRRGRPGC